MDKKPTIDLAEGNAYFPSPYSLTKYTAETTDFDGLEFKTPYRGSEWRVLMIATDERYLLMRNGAFFSTGNHPVEMLLPMHHLDQAGFPIDVVTLSGNPVKLEMWAMPKKDEAIRTTYQKYLPQLKQPKKLTDVLRTALAPDTPYIATFVPGGHGALLGIPHSEEVKAVLLSAMKSDKHVITLCHGPACLLAASIGEPKEKYIYRGYKICVFPDSLDTGANVDIGYIPGPMPWLVGEKLQALGVEIVNAGITGQCHQDRKLITGDSPLASNNVGKLAAEALLREAGV